MLKITMSFIEELISNEVVGVNIETAKEVMNELKNAKNINIDIPVSEEDIETVFKPVIQQEDTVIWSFSSDSGQNVNVHFVPED